MSDDDISPLPFVAPAGCRSAYFNVNVRDDLSPLDALEGASLFLSAAVDLADSGDPSSEAQRWISVHLMEMAKALVDDVVNRTIAEAKQRSS